jgi:cobalt/nickel transport system permease protein
LGIVRPVFPKEKKANKFNKEYSMLFAPTPMHIPDGFLSVLTAILCWLLSVPVIALALRKVGQQTGERQTPIMGVLAAAIFAGQMLNFTVAGGTSGHLLGAALATILLGPWAAVVVMTCVVSVQALIFQDGGLLALGANLLNMAVIGVAVSYTVYRLVHRFSGGKTWGLFAGGFAAAWSSIFIASLAAALQLAISGTSPANLAIPAMGAIHAVIGVGEGLITLGALAFLAKTRPGLVSGERSEQRSSAGNTGIWVGGLVVSLALAVISPLASSHPDGLEWVAGQQGFISLAREPLYRIIPDYVVPGISNQAAATIAAGMIGVIIVLAATWGITRSRKHGAPQEQR